MEQVIECVYKSAFPFQINLNDNTIQWGEERGSFIKLYNGLTGEVTGIAGVYGEYDEFLKSYSYFTPVISKSDITECSNWDRLEELFEEVVHLNQSATNERLMKRYNMKGKEYYEEGL